MSGHQLSAMLQDTICFGPDGTKDTSKKAMSKEAKMALMAERGDALRASASESGADDWRSDPKFPAMDDFGRNKDHPQYGAGCAYEDDLPTNRGTPTPKKMSTPKKVPPSPAAAAVADGMLWKMESLTLFVDALLDAGLKVTTMFGYTDDMLGAEDNPLLADFEPEFVELTHVEPPVEPDSDDSDDDSDDEAENTMPQIALKRVHLPWHSSQFPVCHSCWSS